MSHGSLGCWKSAFCAAVTGLYTAHPRTTDCQLHVWRLVQRVDTLVCVLSLVVLQLVCVCAPTTRPLILLTSNHKVQTAR